MVDKQQTKNYPFESGKLISAPSDIKNLAVSTAEWRTANINKVLDFSRLGSVKRTLGFAPLDRRKRAMSLGFSMPLLP